MGNHTCPVESLEENAAANLFGNTSFYEFNRIFCGACALFAVVVVWVSMFMHGIRFSKEHEQLKILRIALLIPAYAVVSFISVWFPKTYVYLDPWLDFIQAIAVASFFLLLTEFVSHDEATRNQFFVELEVPQKQQKSRKRRRQAAPVAQTPIDGLTWFKSKWFFIFQYPVVSLVCAIATDVTQAAGIYCQFASKTYYAHLWIDIAINVSVTLAVMTVINFYTVMKTHLAQHRPLAKLVSFKLVVFLTFVQGIIFWILRDTNVLKPSATLTWADVNIGIPNMLVCIEMIPLSLFFHYAYSYHPYRLGAVGNDAVDYYGGFLGIKAWIRMLDPREIISATFLALRYRSEQKSLTQQAAGRPQYASSLSSQEPAAVPPQYPAAHIYQSVDMNERHDTAYHGNQGRDQNHY